MKIATWNVNSLTVRLPQIMDWLEAQQPDILALQETKIVDEKFPRHELETMGYQVSFSGQKAYNGVAIVSRHAITDIHVNVPDYVDPQRRILAATINNVRVINLYVPNGQSVFSEKYQYKLNWLAQVKNYIQQQLTQNKRLVVLGDFNIAPEDRDIHDPDTWRGHVLCSEPEREQFRQLLSLGMKDAFRLFEQEQSKFSWWDYRAGAFWRNQGWRIDHILVNENLAAQCVRCEIDKSPRKNKQPSDHAPVIAEFNVNLMEVDHRGT